MPPHNKNLPKIGKKRGKNQEKEEKSAKKKRQKLGRVFYFASPDR